MRNAAGSLLKLSSRTHSLYPVRSLQSYNSLTNFREHLVRALHHGVPRLFPRSEPKNEHVKPKTQGELSLLEKLDMRNYETSIVPLTLDIPDRSFGPLPPIHRRPDGTWGYEDGSVQTKSISIHAMNIGGRISQYLHPSANGMTTDPLLLDAFGAWDISELSEEELTLYQQVQED